jgi:hypothetical protein
MITTFENAAGCKLGATRIADHASSSFDALRRALS